MENEIYELQKELEDAFIKRTQQENYIEFLKEELSKYKRLYHEVSQLVIAQREANETKHIYKAFVKSVVRRLELSRINRKQQRDIAKLEEQQAWLKNRYQEELNEVAIRG